MGVFGSDEPSRGEELADEQIRANQAELESKRKNLYDERLGIIKGQGGQVWEPTPVSAGRSGSGGGSGSSPGRADINMGGWFK